MIEFASQYDSVLTQQIAIIMPDDVADEKAKALLALGAQIEKVRPASIVDKKQVSITKSAIFDKL